MTKVKQGSTLHKVEETTENQLPAVKVVTATPNPIEALRQTNLALTHKLGHLDKIKETEEKIKAFQPNNPESGCTLVIKDAHGKEFKTGNAALVAKTLEVLELEVVAVREMTEAEIMLFAAVKIAA